MARKAITGVSGTESEEVNEVSRPEVSRAEAPEVVGGSSDDFQWETVKDESATVVVFEHPGEALIGVYLGPEVVTPDNGHDEPFTRFVFRGVSDGKTYALNSSYQLKEAMDAVPMGATVKVTFVKEIATGRKLNPMKDYRIDVAKNV